MEITIHLQSTDDLKLMGPLLELLRQAEVGIKIKPAKKVAKSQISASKQANLTEKLHGIVRLPAEFDYKNFMADALLKKYAPHG